MIKALAALVLGSLLLVASPGPASAHADLASSTPRQGAVLVAAPKAFSMRFSEPVTLSSIPPQLLDRSWSALPMTTDFDGRVLIVTPRQPLAPGIVTTIWHVVSDDGHPVSGAIAVQIGKPGPRGPGVAVATVPAVQTILSGSRPGPLTVTFAKQFSSGEVEWTHPRLGAPITWRIAPGTHAAAGVLPLSGSWTMRATLEGRNFTVTIVNGKANLHD
jgi:methionine-rich copper-binding protein CopC